MWWRGAKSSKKGWPAPAGLGMVGEVGGGSGKIPLLGKESTASVLDCHVLLICTSVRLIPQWH